ncbi:hypothetical protein Ddye_019607 [Dipteronia dyeriana]|uniref:Uncharacterized protein n=1 Tax=Dipteronia dyeriana TaxID=168575 RepID=A0AAD9TYP1_9ROSI|nr:hypothetical protein Ddye_019607 [Dipteronia dyeriana]
MADTEQSSNGDHIVASQEVTSERLKHDFSEDEETLIRRMYDLLGKRWHLIAGRIPGRTAEEIEKYWNTIYSTSA